MSMLLRRHGRSSEALSAGQSSAVGMDAYVQMESPPCVMYGPPATSTGSIASGLLVADVKVPLLDVEVVNLELIKKQTNKRSPHLSCPHCCKNVERLQVWQFVSARTSLTKGKTTWPFSALIPGHMPHSFECCTVKVEYYFKATFIFSPTSKLEKRHPIEIRRSILPSTPKSFQRLFPPTSLNVTLQTPNVVHPSSYIPVTFQLTGFKEPNSSTSWAVSRISWRIEERIKTTIRSCHGHDDADKVHTYQDTRILGTNDYKRGWKIDNDRLLFELPLSFALDARYVCDLRLNCGNTELDISHCLVLELVMIEVVGSQPVDSNARLLRMKVKLVVTTQPGLGVSWDEECPPLFDSVGPSPPCYDEVVESPTNESPREPSAPNAMCNCPCP
ncbi:endocytosis regulator [Schizosaccharomyces japonicus yFS275]|uniref:Endocytosis regulator n=1 Tax=Schizosaccharomyces japonicus (strain yFS275 / FY16936) TaxID=402676 RepID=B6K165_SCHJY|nr:endocytosis regulator [Schizosaccharomyces japonicus yFS275]EEB07686.1 endocytosis regulator [Schizosaccharomyces japonicus yFS275]